ncbi:MAG TPA: TIGR01777 family oxidoreductase [Rectinemataceae bacterium]|nr:TIGR01777 family oxidoreductase [Rectinemataceae bacterium]
MRVVLAGGSGYIGASLAASHLTEGSELVVLTRGSESALPGDAPGLRRVAWNGRDPGPWCAALDGADLVVNLAGERVAGPGFAYRWTEARKRLLASSRVEAGKALVAGIAACSRRPQVFVQASGIDYYAAGESRATEDARSGDGFLSRLVADEWEPSTAGVESMGLRRIVLRIGPVIGAGSPVLAPLLLQHRLFAGGPLGPGAQWFPWIAVDDLVGALRFLVARQECFGAYNLVAPGILRNAELSKALARALGRPSWLPTPAFALRLAFGEMAETLLNGVRAIPKRLLEAGYRFVSPDIDTALSSALASRPKP